MLYQYLETFCRVVDEGSFTKAAESLGFSQPTVTKQIHALEEEMGAVLIRRGHRLQLTPAGEIAYSHARRILNTVKECQSAIKALEKPGHGDLNIGAVFTIALFTLPPVLEVYRQEHPNVTVRVRTGTNQHILSLILHNEADVGLTTVPLSHPQISTVRLFDDRVLLVASPNSRWASKKQVTPGELSQLPMISYQRHSQFQGFVQASFAGAGITPHVVMEFDTHEAVKTMVQLGLGVAMAPESAVKDDLASGRLVELEIKDLPPLARTTSLLIRQDRYETPPMRSFCKTLIRLLQAPYYREPDQNRPTTPERG
jgi:DNA-binding transcriptional LysR family regulator